MLTTIKNSLLNPLIKGAVVIFPLLVTAWIVIAAFQWLDSIGISLLSLFGVQMEYASGLGLVVMILLLLGTGFLVQINPVAWLYQYFEQMLLKFPLVKTLYGAVKEFAAMFDRSQPKAQKVVLVKLPGIGFTAGLITSPSVPKPVAEIQEQLINTVKESAKNGNLADVASCKMVPVYLPMSYMVGGYTLFIPEQDLIEVDWSIEDAMRFALTAGISKTGTVNTVKTKTDR